MLSTHDRPLAEAEAQLNAAERHRHDGRAEHDHQLSGEDDEEEREGFASRRRSVPGRPSGGVVADCRCDPVRRSKGIDEDLSNGILKPAVFRLYEALRLSRLLWRDMTDVARQHLAVDKPGEDQGQSAPDAGRCSSQLRTPGRGRPRGVRPRGWGCPQWRRSPAGVGVGTLYRHFPNRIDVVEAVYRTDVDNLVQTAEQVSGDLEPWPAIVAFLVAFVRYAQGSGPSSMSSTAFDKSPDLKLRHDGPRCAMELVVDRAQQAGVIRTDVNGSDLMQLVGPMCTNATLTEDQSTRLLGMILDGLRKET